MEKRNKKRFEDIFNSLGGDANGYLTKDKIAIFNLREEIVIILAPILLKIILKN